MSFRDDPDHYLTIVVRTSVSLDYYTKEYQGSTTEVVDTHQGTPEDVVLIGFVPEKESNIKKSRFTKLVIDNLHLLLKSKPFITALEKSGWKLS